MVARPYASPQGYSGFLHRLIQIDMRSLRAAALLLGLLVYGAFGSPTPDRLGMVEIVVAALLLMAIGASGCIDAVRLRPALPAWRIAGQVFLLFGLSVPFMTAVITGNSAALAARDVAAFLFMALPLMLLRGGGRYAVFATLAVGVLFSLRAGFEVPYLGGGDALFYLANMPSVLFAAIFFAGMAIQVFVQEFNWRALGKLAVFMGLAALCLYPMIETQQRASLGVFALSIALILYLQLWSRPRRTLIIGAFLMAGVIAMWPALSGMLDVLSRKTDLVGVNMRAEEWAAVWAQVSANPLSLMIGQGWGATFSSPAVADIEVNFTHGLLSSLLLKTGLIGLVLGLVYLFALGLELLRRFRFHPVIVLAVAGPVMIDVFLYASFKSLDFGLMLLLASQLRFYGDGSAAGVETNPAVLYQERDIK